ncbi:MAG: Acetylxylan esterase [Candidatus Scalindua arabica]|uniref:Acetylxylan esterase n=1 Tax=Candidatus Scalindua arabica TaxID=1127984 RepID=A0A941W137_9BACT|nr:Acetylxylan esterase [Candidatus Scalindua arabica]
MENLLANRTLILFQGDSITDCGRSWDGPDSLGEGYVRILTIMLPEKYPEYEFKFINRGVSGDKVRDLVCRWDVDCISLQPDWLSILVGVNDTLITPITEFEEEYRTLLKRTTNELNSRVIMCEPFLLSVGNDVYREDLNPKIEVIRKLANEYAAVLVPLDKIFQEACSLEVPEYWAPDGVHPSPEGHALIAKSWIKYLDV